MGMQESLQEKEMQREGHKREFSVGVVSEQMRREIQGKRFANELSTVQTAQEGIIEATVHCP